VLRLEFLALTAKTLAVAAFVLPFGIVANARNGLGKIDCPPSHKHKEFSHDVLSLAGKRLVVGGIENRGRAFPFNLDKRNKVAFGKLEIHLRDHLDLHASILASKDSLHPTLDAGQL